jgi:hypothetical protein
VSEFYQLALHRRDGVRLHQDGAIYFIRWDPKSPEWRRYEAWLRAGNKPFAATEEA